MALLLPPPGTGLTKPIFRSLAVGTRLIRIFDPTQYHTQALTFNGNGPRNRFDHHRQPGGIGLTWNDPDRATYYAARSLSCCLVEVFGDYRLIDRPHLIVAFPSITRKLRLLDLRGSAAMCVGTIAALSGEKDRALTQAWSRYFYEHPALPNCDGLIYQSAHNAEIAYLLYERAQNGLVCPQNQIIALNDPLLRPELLRIASRNGMQVTI